MLSSIKFWLKWFEWKGVAIFVSGWSASLWKVGPGGPAVPFIKLPFTREEYFPKCRFFPLKRTRSQASKGTLLILLCQLKVYVWKEIQRWCWVYLEDIKSLHQLPLFMIHYLIYHSPLIKKEVCRRSKKAKRTRYFQKTFKTPFNY